MKLKKILYLLLIFAVLLCGCDKYTKSQLAEYEKKVTDASPISEEEGLGYVYVFESTNGKLYFSVALDSPAPSYNFVVYCQTYKDIVFDVIDGDLEKLESLSVSYSRNDKPYLVWDTDDLISGDLYNLGDDEAGPKKLTFENGKAEILELPK